MSELVTGEAVALELRPARLPSRALAVLLDLVVTVIVYLVVSIALVAATSSLDEAAQIALSIACFLLVLMGGPIAVETLSHGRSLGKLAFGLRVVRDDGGPIRFRHALVRGAVGVVEILMTFGVVACIASLVSERGRRLGDVFAGTLVVRERLPTAQGQFVPPPPPWLAGHFSGLDLSAVPDGLWLAVRQYLTRMRQLDPQVGWAMAERLAADLTARTGAPMPQGVPPAAYLAAVLHERQAREARRAFGGGPPGSGLPGVGGAPVSSADVPGGYAPPVPHLPVSPVPQPPTPPVSQPPVPASQQSQPPASHPASHPAAAPGRPGAQAPVGRAGEQPEGRGSAAERPATGFVPPA